jgi:hypothetical protein
MVPVIKGAGICILLLLCLIFDEMKYCWVLETVNTTVPLLFFLLLSLPLLFLLFSSFFLLLCCVVLLLTSSCCLLVGDLNRSVAKLALIPVALMDCVVRECFRGLLTSPAPNNYHKRYS